MSETKSSLLGDAMYFDDPTRMGTTPRRLLKFADIPEWYQDNEHIHSGYRPSTRSVKDCLSSLFYLHNETINIYIHLIPALFGLVAMKLADRIFVSEYPLASATDRLVLTVCLATVVLGLGLSATYHTFMNHSSEYSSLWGRIDYCGVLALTFGDLFSGVYMGFYCEPVLQRMYWTMISAFTCATAFVVLSPTFQSRRFRILRLFCFTGTGASSFIPIIHALRIFPFDQLAKQFGLYYFSIECSIILASVIFYGTRFPESRKPGGYDVWGSSHQYFHALTVLAAVAHLFVLKSAYDYNYYVRKC